MKPQKLSLVVSCAGVLLLAALACEDSENIAPDGSTITLSANPAQIVLAGGTQVNEVEILATVRNSVGVPLPGQDVRFTTNSGQLDPPAGTPVATDSLGNAVSIQTGATVGPQLTATSGKATANLTLTAGSAQVAQVLLDVQPTTNLNSCAQTFNLTGTAVDSLGEGVAGFTITFEITTTGATNFTGSFSPLSGVSDVDGEVISTLTLNQTTCNDRCVGAGKDCTSRIRATDTSKSKVSPDVTIQDLVN